MLESELAQYGVFGMWTIANLLLIKWLMGNQDLREKDLIEVIKNNTSAITLVNERIQDLAVAEGRR